MVATYDSSIGIQQENVAIYKRLLFSPCSLSPIQVFTQCVYIGIQLKARHDYLSQDRSEMK